MLSERDCKASTERSANVETECEYPGSECRAIGNWSFTTAGKIAPITPAEIPKRNVIASMSANCGAKARGIVAAAVTARQTAIVVRMPTRRSTRAAGRAKMPMQSTGIVARSPALVWLTPNSAWISGSNGPTPVSCGRSASVPANSPASSSTPASLERSLPARRTRPKLAVVPRRRH